MTTPPSAPPIGGDGEGGVPEGGADPDLYSYVSAFVPSGEVYIFIDGFDEFESGQVLMDFYVEEGPPILE